MLKSELNLFLFHIKCFKVTNFPFILNYCCCFIIFFKKIFKNELSMITDTEEDWPENRTLELFLSWFTIEIGSTVFDLEKNGLSAEKID